MLKIIGTTARRMQRAGFLKHVVVSASPQRPSSSSAIGRTLLRAVGQRHAALVGPTMREYCERVFSEQHYRALRSQVKAAAERQPPGETRLELQDIYLSQDVLPSKRGRILSEKESDIHVFPTLAVSLGFLTHDTYVLTPRGRLFASMITSEEIAAFDRPSDVNPLVISSRQAMLLLFSFIQADGDLARMLYPVIARRSGEFADYEAGDVIGEVLVDYLLGAERSAISMRDKIEISKLKKTAAKIREWKSKKYSGKGARDEWATLRLEPLVDVGLLMKPDKFAYRYAFTDEGRRFSFCLEATKNVDAFLAAEYIGAAAELLGLSGSAMTDDDEVLDSLRESNRLLADNIGYSDVTDTALLSAINLLHERGKVLEIGESLRILKDGQRRTPRGIHFNIDRWGNLKFVNFRKL